MKHHPVWENINQTGPRGEDKYCLIKALVDVGNMRQCSSIITFLVHIHSMIYSVDFSLKHRLK